MTGAASRRCALPFLAAAAVLGTAATGYLALAGRDLGRSTGDADVWFPGLAALSPSRLGEDTAVTLSTTALAVLAAAWLLVGAALRRGAGPGSVLAVGGLWSVPLALGAPLFSPDVYSYAAIGAAVQHGVDPFVDGPAAAGDIPGTRAAEPFWQESPTPYGPPFVLLVSWISRLAGEDVRPFVLMLRGLTVLAWAVLAVLVVRVARHCGVDPGRAVWLGVANPLLLVHTVSGVHSDALVALLTVAGLAAALVRRPAVAVALVAAAAFVKASALALVPVVAVHAAWRHRTWSRRLPVLAGTCALGAGLFALGVQVSGYGWRWTSNLDVPGRVVEPLSPATALAVVLDATDPPLEAVRAAGLAVGALVCLVLLTRVPRWGLLRVAAWVSLTVVLSGAAVWPWYLTTPTVLLALTGRRGAGWLVVGWSVAGLFATRPGGLATLSLLDRPLADALALGVFAAVGAVAVTLQVSSRRRGSHAGRAAFPGA